VATGERIRLFCALQLPAGAVEQLAAWQQAHLSGGRLVPAESLHVTLAFLGHRPVSEVAAIETELRAAAASRAPIELEPRRYRETRSVGMLVLDDLGGAGAALAGELAGRLEAIGVYRPEARPWLPHITVLRFRERPRLRPPLPSLGRVRAVRAALYRSALGPGGARYDVLESVGLGGR
jgi:2'-5' RNA ligase